MAKKKKAGRPQGHYCKICGEYKANEKFSGKGYAAHICKSCSRLSAAEKAEAMTINRLMDLPMGRLSANDKMWQENRLHDDRPEVASLAREVYQVHFPYTERNARKKHLIIDTLTFELHTEFFDEYGDEVSVNKVFTANRVSRILTMTDFDANGVEQSLTLDGGKMSTLLRWVVHSLEIFMWPEDYDLGTSRSSIPPYFDLLPEYWPNEAEEDEDFFDDGYSEDMPEAEDKASWRVRIEYGDLSIQEFASYQDFLSDRPEELYLALLEYFEPESDDFEEECEGKVPSD